MGNPLSNRREWLVAAVCAGAAPPRTVCRRIAFHYEAVFSPSASRWYSRFDLLVTGAILTKNQSEALRTGTNSLVAYEWSSAFYPNDGSSADPEWQYLVEQHKSDWLLDASPVGGGAAAPGREAYWYDFGNLEMIRARATHLATRLRAAGYDGYFFDTLGFSQLPPRLQQAFRTRHPALDYEIAQGAFLKELRARLGAGKTIFTNQGYRRPEAYLSDADFDLTESYFTAQAGTSTLFRRWSGGGAPWEAVQLPMDKLVVPAGLAHPQVRFVHVNYAAGDTATTRRAARYSWACAKMWDHASYLIVPGNPSGEEEEAYFIDTGLPNSEINVDPSGLVWRRFESGVVVLNSATKPVEARQLGSAKIPAQDAVWLKNQKING